MHPPTAPAVTTALMIQQWRRSSFLHWRYPAGLIQPLLPEGLRVQTFDGAAWVSLTPFEMRQVRPPGAPPVPWLSRFAETNLRTYVQGPDAGTGIFFLSKEAARLPVVLAARLSLGLPYHWSAARVRIRDACLGYRGQRRWPGPAGVGYHMTVHVGPRLNDDQLRPLDHFLTARYQFYTQISGRLLAVAVEHPPWPLHRASLVELRQDLLTAAGLPAPESAPLLHTSPGVPVRIGLPRAAGRGRGGGGPGARGPGG